MARYTNANDEEKESFTGRAPLAGRMRSRGRSLFSVFVAPLAGGLKWCIDFLRYGLAHVYSPCRKRFARSERRSRVHKLLLSLLIFLALVGLICAASSYNAIFKFLAFGGMDQVLESHYNVEGPISYASDFTKQVTPIPCHSHNDYWRRVPLSDAIKHGCTSVEADVWLFGGDDKLYVGHDTASLNPWRTFESLYITPIAGLLNSRNQPHASLPGHRPRGVFEQDPFQTLVLLVDFKTFGPKLLPRIEAQLEPLRSKDYLTYFNGTSIVYRPVIVVGTGNAPFDLMVANASWRDIFFDAPLAQMHVSSTRKGQESQSSDSSPQSWQQGGQGHVGTAGFNSSVYDLSNSFYASVSLASSIGYPRWFGTFTSYQLDLIRGQIRGAHSRGLQARFWSTPSWPRSLRNHVWSVLLSEGADVLNADDLNAARQVLSGNR